MKKILFSLNALVALSILMCGLPGIANAGYKFSYPGECGPWGTSGKQQYCWGKLVDIAAETADPNRYAYFTKTYSNGITTLFFHMEYNNAVYECYAPPTSSMIDMWSSFMNNKVTFRVVFDNKGVCTYAMAGPDSSNLN